MMEIRQVEFNFKGRRDYIQGPDIFNKMTDTGYSVECLSNIRFLAQNFVHTPICQIYSSDNKEDLTGLSDICARCQFDVDHTTRWLALTPLVTETMGERCEFDEEKIISLCHLDGNVIALPRISPFSFIETIVSMNKYLHQRLFPDIEGKWIFTRIDLDTGCNEREKLELHFKHNMNFRLTKSEIWVDSRKIGDIYFSLVKP